APPPSPLFPYTTLFRSLHNPVPGRSPRPGWLASISARPSVTRIAMSLRLLTIATLLLGGTAQAGGVTVYKYTDAAGVVTYSDRAVPGAAVLRLGDEAEERLESRVRLEVTRHPAGETLRVHNDLHAPVQIELALENVENATGVPDRPLRWIL